MESKKIDVSDYGSLLVYKSGYTPQFVEQTIKALRLNGLRIWTDPMEHPPVSLDFLKSYTFLESLDVTSLCDYDFGFLNSLIGLKKLSISTEGKSEIDLSEQKNLEFLVIQWRKDKIKGLERCQKIKELCLVDYGEIGLTQISELKRLRSLSIKTGSIRTLHGLENLMNLEAVMLGNCRTLTSISSLNGKRLLKSLEIEKCPRIGDYDSLTDLPSLDTLRLIDCNGISSMQFIERFPSLARIGLLGNTNVCDGNITLVESVKERLYTRRKHYFVE